MGNWISALLVLMFSLFFLPPLAFAGSEEDSSYSRDSEGAPTPEEDGGSEEEGDEGEDEEEMGDEEETIADVAHEYVSRGVLAPARWIDSFFADERVEAEETETRVRLRLSNFTSEDRLIELRARPAIRLDLPLFSERFRLLLTDDPDEPDVTRAGRFREEFPSRREEGFSVSLRYFLLSTLDRNVSLRFGVRLRSGVPHLLVEPRYRETIHLDENWDLRFTQRLITLTDGSVEARTIFDFERPVMERYFFRSTAEGSWQNDEHGYFYAFRFAFYQALSQRRVIEYLWSNSFQTHPTHALEDVVLRFTYRQRIWRDWLFAEVAPQVSFPRERDYDFSPGILLRLEFVFGSVEKIRDRDRAVSER